MSQAKVEWCKCESCPIHHKPVKINEEMLEALETLLNAFQNGCETIEDREGLVLHIEEIIKKARGE